MNSENYTMKIAFWGVRGSIPTPAPQFMKYGGNTACIEVRCGDTILIFDAGTGIKDLGISLAKEYGDKDLDVHVLISHTHWDHIQGLPFFSLNYMKNKTINFYGGHFYSDLKTLLSKQMEKEFFPVALNELQAKLNFNGIDDNPFFITDEIKVYHTYLLHPTLSLGFRVEYKDLVFVYATDNELLDDEEMAEFNERNINNLFINADILVADSQYTLDEYTGKIGWGHSSIEKLVQIGKEFGVKQILLFHHDPFHDDIKLASIEKKAKELAGKEMKVKAAKEGMIIEL